MILPPSKYDPLGTPLLPDPQEETDDDPGGDEPEDARIEEWERDREEYG